jgi:hypothetical protein
MEISSVAISAPSAPAATAIQSAALALAGCVGFVEADVPAAPLTGVVELVTPVFPFDALCRVASAARVHVHVDG